MIDKIITSFIKLITKPFVVRKQK